ncbi:MAG: hypothetical protein PF638_13390 [Candidatus Delongbacteria bacterium]|jgi:hypothetical protein|nr:hypothetical protein [Candidatus Delongbacteria bacterium]
MNNILVGNGVNLQFSNREYLNNEIISRGVKKLNTGAFPENIYPKEIHEFLKKIFLIIPGIIKNEYDALAITSYEKKVLQLFKRRNKVILRTNSLCDIGIEDYLFAYTIFCRINKIENPDRYNIMKFLERFLIDSIYNDGKINKVYEEYPDGFINWINHFDTIFTTNYDSNLDTISKKNIYHLHGAFHILDEVYDKNSIRNQLELDDYDYFEGFDHLYSNALLDFSGFGKEFMLKRSELANSGIDKYAEAYSKGENQDVIADIDSFKNNENPTIRNLYKGIMLRINEPENKFEEYYHFSDFKNIKDELTILGLSPNNDNHIFEAIQNNNSIKKIIYYYYDYEEAKNIEKIFKHKYIELIRVKEFWGQFQEVV